MKQNRVWTNEDIKTKLCFLYDEVFAHEGYARIEIDMRVLRRGQKEVILRCGKEYRYVVDFQNSEEGERIKVKG